MQYTMLKRLQKKLDSHSEKNENDCNIFKLAKIMKVDNTDVIANKCV